MTQPSTSISHLCFGCDYELFARGAAEFFCAWCDAARRRPSATAPPPITSNRSGSGEKQIRLIIDCGGSLIPALDVVVCVDVIHYAPPLSFSFHSVHFHLSRSLSSTLFIVSLLSFLPVYIPSPHSPLLSAQHASPLPSFTH